MIEKLVLKGVRVLFDDLSHIQMDVPLNEQLFSLKEDLLQLETENQLIIDVGYYPDFTPNGSFTIQVIKEFEWNEPIWLKTCKDTATLIDFIQESIDTYS